jgi:hypothetical protein
MMSAPAPPAMLSAPLPPLMLKLPSLSAEPLKVSVSAAASDCATTISFAPAATLPSAMERS